MVGPLFTWTDLNKIANLINKRGINCNYKSTLTIDSFVISTHPTHGNEAKAFFKVAKTLVMKELDVHIGGNTVWVSNEKAHFQKIREHSHMIWLVKYNLS